MDSLYLFPPDDNTSMKTCKGPCGRTLPATTQFFSRGETCKDGLRGKCKKCETEQKKRRKDNPVKSDPIPTTEGYKRCTGPCGQEYPATTEYFHKHQRAKNGLHPQCKKCTNERIKKHREIPEVRERFKEQKKEYFSRPEVKERIKAQNYKSRTKEYQKEYRSRPEVKERYSAKAKEHRNRPDIKEYRRNYGKEYYNRPEVKEHAKEHAKEYRKEYRNRPRAKELDRVRKRNRKARKSLVEGSCTLAQIREQLKRQKYRCYYAACGHAKFEKKNGKYVYHVEHTYPISRVAGTDIPANSIDYIVLACPTCNLSKGDKFPWEWPEGGHLF